MTQPLPDATDLGGADRTWDGSREHSAALVRSIITSWEGDILDLTEDPEGELCVIMKDLS